MLFVLDGILDKTEITASNVIENSNKVKEKKVHFVSTSEPVKNLLIKIGQNTMKPTIFVQQHIVIFYFSHIRRLLFRKRISSTHCGLMNIDSA